jgi:hypothetical protein
VIANRHFLYFIVTELTSVWLHVGCNAPRPDAAEELRKATPDNPEALRLKIRLRFSAVVRATCGVVGRAGGFQ